MAFISNKERNKRVKQSNQSYGLRKLFISLTVAALILLIIFAVVTINGFSEVAAKYQSEGDVIQLIKDICAQPLSLFKCWEEGSSLKTGLSGFGIFMIIWVLITLGLSIVSLILMLTMKSPKAAKKNINVLQGAALSGKKLAAHANATQVYRERGTNTKKLKKINAKKRK